LNTVPKVEGEILALRRFVKDEKRAICIALWRISFSVSCIDSNFSHNPLNDIMTLPKFGVKKVCGNFHFQKKESGRKQVTAKKN
jgi:hypothetical protein